jgi:uncharacterized membrane protein YccF (DUF307 family)
MKLLGNIIWFFTGGFIEAAVWFFTGIAFFLSVIFIPYGFQAFKLARLALHPFGRRVETDIARHPFANVVWNLLGGFAFVVVSYIIGILLCCTIVLIPFGRQWMKLGKLCFAPVGATVEKK